MAEDISSKVKKIVADHLGIDEVKVTDEASFIDDLGADSLDTVCNELEGCPEILINNAGITKDNLSLRMSQEEWQQVIDVNLTSTFLLCKFFLKKMIKNKAGKIVNITSVVGHTGNVGQANYAASKSGIIGMSKSLALEYAKKNININCISPGFIKTNMTDTVSYTHLTLPTICSV